MITVVGCLMVGIGFGTLFGWFIGFRMGQEEADERHRRARRYANGGLR